MAPKIQSFHISELQHLTVSDILQVGGALVIIYCISKAIYNIYFHPLSKFPGPKLAAITDVCHMRESVGGRSCFINKELHDKYGPVVRVAPNELSFCSATSWRNIYGHIPGRKQFLKTKFYKSELPPNIINVSDSHTHGQMRKLLSHGFSQRALMEQEDIVQHYVDLLIKQIDTHATGKEGGEEMVKWYNFTTFDIIGDLAFGEPFGSLNDAKPHFWVSLILQSIEFMPWNACFQRVPLLGYLKPFFVSKQILEARESHLEYTRKKIQRRIASTKPRKDFLSRILAEKEAQNIPIEELWSHAHVLIIAGSETTATFLSGVTYYLCRTPHAYAALAKEVRDTFKNYEDIQGHTTESLRYLKAVIDEGLRIYPPVSIGLPRASPGETVDGNFVPEGTVVSTWAWAATHSEENFHRPYDFLPERWIDPECKDKKEASQPFMLGARVCLGRNLALMEMRTILAKMFWTFDMEMIDKEMDWDKENGCYTLWKKPKLNVKFTRRAGINVPILDN